MVGNFLDTPLKGGEINDKDVQIGSGFHIDRVVTYTLAHYRDTFRRRFHQGTGDRDAAEENNIGFFGCGQYTGFIGFRHFYQLGIDLGKFRGLFLRHARPDNTGGRTDYFRYF